MPSLETDFDRGYKKGRGDAISPPSIFDQIERSKAAERRKFFEQAGIYNESDYEKGYRKGWNDVKKPPSLLDAYKNGYHDGNEAARRKLIELLPNEANNCRYEIE